MPGPTTEVLSEDLKSYRAEVQSTAVSLAGLRAEVGIAKWLFGLVAGTLLISFTSGIWWSATLLSETRALDFRLGKLEDRFDKVDARLDKLQSSVDARFEKVDARLDKLQASIDQIAVSIRDQAPRIK